MLNYVHEAWHVIAATVDGVEADIVNNRTTTLSRYTPYVIYMGYFGEVITYTGLAAILAYSSKTWYFSGFPFGILHYIAYYRAPRSADFLVHAAKLFTPAGVREGLIRWYIITSIIILIGWIITIKRFRRGNVILSHAKSH